MRHASFHTFNLLHLVLHYPLRTIPSTSPLSSTSFIACSTHTSAPSRTLLHLLLQRPPVFSYLLHIYSVSSTPFYYMHITKHDIFQLYPCSIFMTPHSTSFHYVFFFIQIHFSYFSSHKHTQFFSHTPFFRYAFAPFSSLPPLVRHYIAIF